MIVVAGEALVDLIPSPLGELSVSVGGGPLNTARWLGRLGQRVAYLGAVSEDLFGTQIRDSLSDCGVSLELVRDTPLPTTLALAQLDAAGVARYRFYTQGTSVPDLSAEQARALLTPEFEVLQLGGLGLMLEPVADALEAAVQVAGERGAMVMLDPNVRPSLIPDRERYLARLQRVLRRTHLLKLSLEDLDWLHPGEDPIGAAMGMLPSGPSAVLLTTGEQGATVVTAADVRQVPAQKVAVVDTIGAGDAFNAGFLSSWLGRGAGLELLADPAAVIESARAAVSVAALACTQKGATPPALIPAVA